MGPYKRNAPFPAPAITCLSESSVKELSLQIPKGRAVLFTEHSFAVSQKSLVNDPPPGSPVGPPMFNVQVLLQGVHALRLVYFWLS